MTSEVSTELVIHHFADAVASLYFEPWNLLNTELRAADTGAVRYTFSTALGVKNRVTFVRKANGTEAAKLVWRDMLSDKLSLHQGAEKSVKEFFSKKKFADENDNQYVWLDEFNGYILELYAVKDKERTLIARFRTPSKHPETKEPRPAELAMNATAVRIEDLAVISLMLLLKSNRGRELNAKAYTAVAIGAAATATTAAGNLTV